MKYWVFNQEQLDRALAAREAELQLVSGATPERAKGMSQDVRDFLVSLAARNAGLLNDDGRG